LITNRDKFGAPSGGGFEWGDSVEGFQSLIASTSDTVDRLKASIESLKEGMEELDRQGKSSTSEFGDAKRKLEEESVALGAATAKLEVYQKALEESEKAQKQSNIAANQALDLYERIGRHVQQATQNLTSLIDTTIRFNVEQRLLIDTGRLQAISLDRQVQGMERLANAYSLTKKEVMSLNRAMMEGSRGGISLQTMETAAARLRDVRGITEGNRMAEELFRAAATNQELATALLRGGPASGREAAGIIAGGGLSPDVEVAITDLIPRALTAQERAMVRMADNSESVGRMLDNVGEGIRESLSSVVTETFGTWIPDLILKSSEGAIQLALIYRSMSSVMLTLGGMQAEQRLQTHILRDIALGQKTSPAVAQAQAATTASLLSRAMMAGLTAALTAAAAAAGINYFFEDKIGEMGQKARRPGSSMWDRVGYAASAAGATGVAAGTAGAVGGFAVGGPFGAAFVGGISAVLTSLYAFHQALSQTEESLDEIFSGGPLSEAAKRANELDVGLGKLAADMPRKIESLIAGAGSSVLQLEGRAAAQRAQSLAGSAFGAGGNAQDRIRETEVLQKTMLAAFEEVSLVVRSVSETVEADQRRLKETRRGIILNIAEAEKAGGAPAKARADALRQQLDRISRDIGAIASIGGAGAAKGIEEAMDRASVQYQAIAESLASRREVLLKTEMASLETSFGGGRAARIAEVYSKAARDDLELSRERDLLANRELETLGAMVKSLRLQIAAAKEAGGSAQTLAPLLELASSKERDLQRRSRERDAARLEEAKAAAQRADGIFAEGFQAATGSTRMRRLSMESEAASIAAQIADTLGSDALPALEAKAASAQRKLGDLRLALAQVETSTSAWEEASLRLAKNEQERQAIRDEATERQAANRIQIENEIARASAEAASSRLEAAKRVGEFERRFIERDRQIAETRLDLAQSLGADWTTMMSAQRQILSLKSQELEIARQELAAMERVAPMARETLQKQADVARQAAEIEKSRLGAQRDFLDKALGRMFGNLGGSRLQPILNDRLLFGEHMIGQGGMRVAGGSRTIGSREREFFGAGAARGGRFPGMPAFAPAGPGLRDARAAADMAEIAAGGAEAGGVDPGVVAQAELAESRKTNTLLTDIADSVRTAVGAPRGAANRGLHNR
jgi:hypothetical protein